MMQQNHAPLSYIYKPKPWLMALVVLFFAGCSAVLFQSALTNTQTLRLIRVVTLDPQGARDFYALLAAMSAMFALAGLFGFWRGLTSREVLQITTDEVIVPKPGIAPKLITVPLKNITGLERTSVQNQVFLHIHHTGGKLSVARQLFSNDDAFEEFVRALTDRISASPTQAMTHKANQI